MLDKYMAAIDISLIVFTKTIYTTWYHFTLIFEVAPWQPGDLWNISPFLPVKTIVVSFLISLCSKIPFIANNMDPDQTAP